MFFDLEVDCAGADDAELADEMESVAVAVLRFDLDFFLEEAVLVVSVDWVSCVAADWMGIALETSRKATEQSQTFRITFFSLRK